MVLLVSQNVNIRMIGKTPEKDADQRNGSPPSYGR